MRARSQFIRRRLRSTRIRAAPLAALSSGKTIVEIGENGAPAADLDNNSPGRLPVSPRFFGTLVSSARASRASASGSTSALPEGRFKEFANAKKEVDQGQMISRSRAIGRLLSFLRPEPTITLAAIAAKGPASTRIARSVVRNESCDRNASAENA